MAFFLAITSWPYAGLCPELAQNVATKDYRKYSLVVPVIRPKSKTLEELEQQLGKAFKAVRVCWLLSSTAFLNGRRGE